MTKRVMHIIGAAAAALMLTAAMAPVSAQQYPDRVVKIQLGFPAGGGADLVLDDEAAAQRLLQLVGIPARQDVGATAGGESDLDFHHAIRILLRRSRRNR